MELFMKRFKEFLYLFVPYFILTALQILLFVLSDTGGFFGNSYLIKLLISPSLIIILFNNFIMFGIPSLLLTGIFAFVIRKKNNDIGRRKYYIYLFLISLMAPIIILLISTGKYDFINHTIFTIQTGIIVVFIHWAIEWIAEKFKKKKVV